MATNLTSIGFPVHTQGQFEALAEKLMPETIAVGDKYLHWRSPDGAELWLQLGTDGHVVSVTPHFSSGATIKLNITQRVVRPGAGPLDGAFFGWGRGDDEDVPFVFDAPDFRAHDELELPSEQPVQLTAFTQELQIYASPEAYRDFQHVEPRGKSQDILPIGLFTPEGDEIDPPESRIIMTGHVLETKELTNNVTGAHFHYVRLDTLGGDIDVVLDPEFVTAEVVAGGVISGTFSLVGRIQPS